jgi:hypothetical protein
MANAVFMANCMNNPHTNFKASKRNIGIFQRYVRRLERRINGGQFETTVWDKIKAKRKKKGK